MAKRKIDFTVRDAWDQDSLLVYKEAVSRYPYCAPARLSFLLNLKALDDPDYERELTLTALSVPDRQRLRKEVEAVEARLAAARPDKDSRRGRIAAARQVAGAEAVASGRRMTEGMGGARQAVLAGGAAADGTAAVDRAVDFGAVAANEPMGRPAASAGTVGLKPGDGTQTGVVAKGVAAFHAATEPKPAAVSQPVAVSHPTPVSHPAPASQLVAVSQSAPASQPAPAPRPADGAESLPEILNFEPLVEDDYIEIESRSRSPRRNARRLVRRHEIWTAQRQAIAESEAEAEAADGASAVTISMLWAAPAEPQATQPDLLVPMPKAPSPMRLFKRRRRPEAFNPWAEVFTSKNTLSDSLQAVIVASPASAPAADVPPAAPVQPMTVPEAVRPAQPTVPSQTAAPVQPAAHPVAVNPVQPAKPSRRRPSPAASRPAPVRAVAMKPTAATRAASPEPPTRRPASASQPVAPATAARPAAKPDSLSAVKPAPGYIDPNELIDRFLRKNDDHILIQVDETRDYSAFDPDRGSLREDWSMGSETLAQLYLKQGAPDKAIEIYRYLGLKFPKKKRYFAGLIRAAENAKGRK